MTVFIITTMAFSLATTVLFQKSDFPDDIGDMDRPLSSVVHLFWVAIGEVDSSELIGATRNVGLTLVVHGNFVDPAGHRILVVQRLMTWCRHDKRAQNRARNRILRE